MVVDWVTLALEQRLTGLNLRILALITQQRTPNRLLLINKAEVAAQLQVNRSHVSRSVTQLCEKGVLSVLDEKRGRSHVYLLDPRYYTGAVPVLNPICLTCRPEVTLPVVE